MQKNSLLPGTFWNGSISGRADSIISFIALSRTAMERLLPPGLQLAEQPFTPSNLHPVYFAFNLKQQNVTTPIPFIKLNYTEFAVGIPFVQIKGVANPVSYAYSPVLYLNSLLGTIGGRLFFSLPKHFVHIDLDTGPAPGTQSFEASQLFNNSNRYLKAAFNNDGPAMPSNNSPHFLQVKPMLNQALVVYDSVKGFRSTSYRMEGLDTCTIQPISGTCNTADMMNGLEHQNLTLQSINASVLGTFQIEYDWTLNKAEPVNQ